ncbi:MAG: DNA gyrase inhibitor YacG [Pseudomonadota bacterium]
MTSSNSKTAIACPICRKSSIVAYKPFCSRRCADVDLHRWLSAGYAIPAVEDDSDGVDGDIGDGER